MRKRWHDHINDQEWEALCDGCGLCCMHKFEDEDTGEILSTNVACRLFDSETCRCTQYASRFEQVPDCLDLRKMSDDEMAWLPKSCAYRLTFEGKPLPDWHHLNSGSADSVHLAGISMKDICFSELEVSEEEMIHHIIDERS